MSEKKYQVFISSTFNDLFTERQIISNILWTADCIPIGMESFVATDSEQFEVIKKVIDDSDYFILLIGKCYGTINPDTGKSYTEMEYEYALEKKIPILVFTIDDSVNLPEEKQDQDQNKIEKLKNFKEKVMQRRLAKVWKTPEELSAFTVTAILMAIKENPRPGWVRYSKYNETELLKKIVNLQAVNHNLSQELKIKEKQIFEIKSSSDIISSTDFDESTLKKEIKIEYFKIEKPGELKTKLLSLEDLFIALSIELSSGTGLDYSIDYIIKRRVSGDPINLVDPQLTKKITLLFSSQGLIEKEKSAIPMWTLTSSGQSLLNKLLVKSEFGL